MNHHWGIRGKNYVYYQDPGGNSLFSQFIIAPGWEWNWGVWIPTGWYTAGYYQWSTNLPWFTITWKYGPYHYEEIQHLWQAEWDTYHFYEIYNNWGTYFIYVDDVKQKEDTFWGGGGAISCMASKHLPSGQCYGWFSELGWCDWDTPWAWWYDLEHASNRYVDTYKVSEYCFGTYAVYP